MGSAARTYIYSVIGLGGLVLASSLPGQPGLPSGFWLIYAALTVLASMIKLQLPGMNGTYSLSSLFLLYGLVHLSLPETLIAGCAGAVAQSLWNAEKRDSLIRTLFNCASICVSIGLCFGIARVWLPEGTAHYPLALIALVACVWFISNTFLISGVLSLLQRKPPAEVCGQWYAWSFPCYLIGVALVGLAPAPGQPVSGVVPGDAWLILLPVLYLVHFFLGLMDWHTSGAAIGNQPNAPLPQPAQRYLAGVVASGALLLVSAFIGWQTQSLARFITYLTLAVIASTFKIRLPYIRATISPSFVILLASIAQLGIAETLVTAAMIGIVQVLWRPSRRPMLAQVLFNPTCQIVSAAIAWCLSRVALEPSPDHSVVSVLVVSTLVLYTANTVMVAAMLALVDGKSIAAVWQHCCFWSLPYYMVGAAAAGVMTATSRTADWPPSLLVLPLMGLVYISYRMQLAKAISGSRLASA